MYVYMYIHTYTHIHLHTYIYTYLHIYIYINNKELGVRMGVNGRKRNRGFPSHGGIEADPLWQWYGRHDSIREGLERLRECQERQEAARASNAARLHDAASMEPLGWLRQHGVTPADAEALLKEAADTIRRLPWDGPIGYRSSMPTPLRDYRDLWANALETGQWEAMAVRPGPTHGRGHHAA